MMADCRFVAKRGFALRVALAGRIRNPKSVIRNRLTLYDDFA
jgi:hypothetical protein